MSRRAPSTSTDTHPRAGDFHIVPIRRQTMAMQIRALLRKEIIGGHLLPRAALSEQELSNRFGVSRTPVREALIKLAEESLVAIYPQHGTFVAPINLAEVFDSQFVREALECAAVERAIERIEPAHGAALLATLDRQRLMQRGGDEDGFIAADEQMHALIMEIAGHGNAWRQVENAKAQMDRVRHLTIRFPRKPTAVIAEHAAIVDRVIHRDCAGALQAMRTHLRGLFGSVELLQKQNPTYFADDARVALPAGAAPSGATARA